MMGYVCVSHPASRALGEISAVIFVDDLSEPAAGSGFGWAAGRRIVGRSASHILDFNGLGRRTCHEGVSRFGRTLESHATVGGMV